MLPGTRDPAETWWTTIAKIRLTAELKAGGDDAAAAAAVAWATERATPVLCDVLRRYPPAPASANRLARIMSMLDDSLRGTREQS